MFKSEILLFYRMLKEKTKNKWVYVINDVKMVGVISEGYEKLVNGGRIRESRKYLFGKNVFTIYHNFNLHFISY